MTSRQPPPPSHIPRHQAHRHAGSKSEHIPVTVYASSESASKAVAAEIGALIRERAAAGRAAVLGLATGSAPTAVYNELVRLHGEEGLSFRNVVAFNLDEYWPMRPDDLQSYRRYMQEYLFDHVDIDPPNIHVPDGTIRRADVGAWCEGYERAIGEAGGIDIQILGVGRTGHIGFNEPGSPRDSRTRLITLDRVTRMDAASDFFGERNVPRTAITMGVATILDARRVVLLAFGEHKAAIIRRSVEGDAAPTVAASFLQRHPSASIVLDPAAAAELTRFKTPWLLGPIEDCGGAWDVATTRRAVIWLSTIVGRPILTLTDEHYIEHGLQDLLAARGGAYGINLEVFRALQGTLTGWPGGRPGTPTPRGGPGTPTLRGGSEDPTDSPEAAPELRGTQKIEPAAACRDAREVYPKRVLVFSPHPDDDVISMGGTFIRLCDQGHDVHVAYQTSGNIAVWDEAALRHVDFVREFAGAFPQLGREFAERLEDTLETFVAHKRSGQPDSPELQRIKTIIRRVEARAAAKYSGVREQNIHFLDLPFYETGRVRKKPLGEEDVRITMDLLERIRPHQIYAAGDLSDPHGTHRVCLAVITRALSRLADRDWARACVVWLYRGAWQEWGPEEIEMAVPLSPEEVRRKRIAIFKHESQKDYALFPGPNDPREFWQRAEDRNRATAALYDRLGLAEYEAIEGFVRWKPAP